MGRGESDKLPGLWVTQEQLELVLYMACQNLDEVIRIKRQANGYDDRPWERNNR